MSDAQAAAGAQAAELARDVRVPRLVPTRRVNMVIEHAIRELLVGLGEDPDREGLRDTPARAAAFWQEFIEADPGHLTCFEEQADEMVVVSGIRVWSICEHHLLPFWADVSMGYIASGRVLGLSKFCRIAQACARRLQVQERMVAQMADMLSGALGDNPDVAVTATGEHLCMVMRGVRERQARTTTSVMRGQFRDKPEARAEFMSLARA